MDKIKVKFNILSKDNLWASVDTCFCHQARVSAIKNGHHSGSNTQQASLLTACSSEETYFIFLNWPQPWSVWWNQIGLNNESMKLLPIFHWKDENI